MKLYEPNNKIELGCITAALVGLSLVGVLTWLDSTSVSLLVVIFCVFGVFVLLPAMMLDRRYRNDD